METEGIRCVTRENLRNIVAVGELRTSLHRIPGRSFPAQCGSPLSFAYRAHDVVAGTSDCAVSILMPHISATHAPPPPAGERMEVHGC